MAQRLCVFGESVGQRARCGVQQINYGGQFCISVTRCFGAARTRGGWGGHAGLSYGALSGETPRKWAFL